MCTRDVYPGVVYPGVVYPGCGREGDEGRCRSPDSGCRTRCRNSPEVNKEEVLTRRCWRSRQQLVHRSSSYHACHRLLPEAVLSPILGFPGFQKVVPSPILGFPGFQKVVPGPIPGFPGLPGGSRARFLPILYARARATREVLDPPARVPYGVLGDQPRFPDGHWWVKSRIARYPDSGPIPGFPDRLPEPGKRRKRHQMRLPGPESGVKDSLAEPPGSPESSLLCKTAKAAKTSLLSLLVTFCGYIGPGTPALVYPPCTTPGPALPCPDCSSPTHGPVTKSVPGTASLGPGPLQSPVFLTG